MISHVATKLQNSKVRWLVQMSLHCHLSSLSWIPSHIFLIIWIYHSIR